MCFELLLPFNEEKKSILDHKQGLVLSENQNNWFVLYHFQGVWSLKSGGIGMPIVTKALKVWEKLTEVFKKIKNLSPEKLTLS